MTICVYASEVAALAGMHPYRPRAQVITALLKRRSVDALTSAHDMQERAGDAAAEAQRKARELQTIADAKVTAAKWAETGEDGNAEDHRATTTQARLVAAKATAAAASAAKRAAVAMADASAANRVVMETQRLESLDAMVSATLRKPSVAHSLQRAVASSTSTTEALKRFAAKTHARDPRVVCELNNTVSCRMGKKMEAKNIEQYSAVHVPAHVNLDVKQRGYTRAGLKTSLGTSYTLFGRLDGLRDDGTVVETKNRRNRLFGYVPAYERIQLHAYMILTSTTQAVLVENFEEDQRAHDVPFDASFWYDTVLPALACGIDEVQRREHYIRDPNTTNETVSADGTHG